MSMCFPWFDLVSCDRLAFTVHTIFNLFVFFVADPFLQVLCVGMLNWQTKAFFFFFLIGGRHFGQTAWSVHSLFSCQFWAVFWEATLGKKITGLLLAMLMSAAAFSTWLFFSPIVSFLKAMAMPADDGLKYPLLRLWERAWWWVTLSPVEGTAWAGTTWQTDTQIELWPPACLVLTSHSLAPEILCTILFSKNVKTL